MIKELMTENFNDEIKDGLVLVDFYATWCGPCKMMHPVIDEVAFLYKDLKIIKVNVDNHSDLSREYGVMSIPTIILFKDGNIVEKNIGFTPKEVLNEWINKHN